MVVKTEVLVTITSETGIVSVGGTSCPRIRLTAEATQKTVHPVVEVDLFLENGAPIADRIMAFEYRLSGDAEWILDGVELTDEAGSAQHVMSAVLEDAPYEIRATAGTVANGLIGLFSNTITVTTDKPDEAPILPPSYTAWIDTNREGKYGFLASMYVTQGAAVGTKIGRIPALNKPKPAAIQSMSDPDFAVDPSTGMISLANSSKTPGTYYVTLTFTNIVGAPTITVPIVVVPTTGLTRTYFVDPVDGLDTNDGKTPATAFKTFSKANGIRGSDIFSVYTILMKRGTESLVSSSVYGHSLRNHTVIGAYGDPSDEPPHLRTDVAAGAAVGSNVSGTLTNVTLRDLKITGTKRGINLSDGTGCSFIRLRIEKNSEFGNGIYLHGYVNSVIYHCTIVPGVNGDGLYLRKFRQSKVRWCDVGIPAGAGADNLQVTSERKAGMEPADVEISDNIFRHSILSNATKGNIVVEGASRVLIERNDCEGNYFCISSLSSLVTIRDNYLRAAMLNDNSFGLGTGAIVHTRDQRWIFNRIEGCWVAMAISGYDDPEGGWQRLDYEVLYNTARKNKLFFKQDRPATGFVNDNVAEMNSNNGFSGGGGNAAGYTNSVGTFVTPDYPAFTKGPNFTNVSETDQAAAAPTISGAMSPGSVLTVDVPAIPGATAEVQWLLNDQRVAGEKNLTYTVPATAAVNGYVPTSMNTPTISCAVVYSFVDGRTLVLPARYDDGWVQRAIAA